MFRQHMVTAKLSPVTIKDRMELLVRYWTWLDGTPLLTATVDDLVAFQHTYSHRSPATCDIYTRHVQAFYRWAVLFELIEANPTRRMVSIKVRQGRPHPTKPDQMRAIFACATASLRIGFVLAGFAGLRCGEICRLKWDDLTLDVPTPTAVINGKGGKERVIPLLGPVVAELDALPGNRRGPVLINRAGHPYRPEFLSATVCRWLKERGIDTTLHSLRHAYATSAAQLTRDPLFCRDLLGHSSVATTEIYMQTSMHGAHDRLAGMAVAAEDYLTNRLPQALDIGA